MIPVPDELFGVAPWVILTAILSWGATLWVYRDRLKKEKIEQSDRLEIHRDELTFELLQNARQEMSRAHVETENLRDEVRKLRSIEQHYYHFQQSLDHLEALLFSGTVEARETAERNARAFLTRMRRLNEAKGTIANETQRAASQVRATGIELDALEKGIQSDD